MKRFLRGLGIVLLGFNGSAVISILFSIPTFLRSDERPFIMNLFILLLLLLTFCGLFALGYKLYSTGDNKQPKQTKSTKPTHQPPIQQPSNLSEKKPQQTLYTPTPRPIKMNECVVVDPTVTAHDIYSLPEEVELINCPFDDKLKDIGPDGLSNDSHVALWLRPREDADPTKTIRVLADWLKQRKTRAEELKEKYWLQYWAIANNRNYLYVLLIDNAYWLDDVPTDVLALCKKQAQERICIAMLTEQGMHDLVTGAEFIFGYEEWPGMVDDAATYGKWWLDESIPAKTTDAPDSREKTSEPATDANHSAFLSLDKLTDLILSDCREFGADNNRIDSIKKEILLQAQAHDTYEGYHLTYDPETHSYWLDYFEKGKASGGIEDISPLNFRYKFLRDFIFHNPQKSRKNKLKWETFLRLTHERFNMTADYQQDVLQCQLYIPEFAMPTAYKEYLSWKGSAIPIESEQIQSVSKDELIKLSFWPLPRPLTKYHGKLFAIPENNTPEQWRNWNRHQIILYREDQGFFHAPLEELKAVYAAHFEVRVQGEWFIVTSILHSFSDRADTKNHAERKAFCMIADPKYELSFHTHATDQQYGAGVVIELEQAEEVRLRLGKPVIDPLKVAPWLIHSAVENYYYENLETESKEPLLKDREKARKTLTSEEAFLKAIHKEGLDRRVDFKMNNNDADEKSIRLNRMEDGSYELYRVGTREIDKKEWFQDPFEAFYTARHWLRLEFLFFSSDDKQKPVSRKGKIIWNGGISVPVKFDQVHDSSVEELLAFRRGFSCTRLIARFGNEIYIPAWHHGKIQLKRIDDTVVYTVSPDEVDGIYVVQFDVRYQGEWFLCFSIGQEERPEHTFSCLIDDPDYKTALHSQHSCYMWGTGVEINSSQIEAVRMWQGVPPDDIIVWSEDNI